jgi:hypothetical protein
LNEDRDLPADANVADFDHGCFSALDLRHGYSLPDLSMQVSDSAGQPASEAAAFDGIDAKIRYAGAMKG